MPVTQHSYLFKLSILASSDVLATVSTNKEEFKYYILQSIMAATTLSPIRVANLQVGLNIE